MTLRMQKLAVPSVVNFLFKERLLYFGFTFYNTIIILVLAISNISVHWWYWIGVFLILLFNNIILLSFPKYRKIYRTFTTILVFLGSLAAIILIEEFGFILMGFNLLYIFGLPNFNKKYDIRDDPFPW